MTATVMALVSTAVTGATAQVGVRAPAMPLRDSPPTSPLFTPNTKSALTGHGWTSTLPGANVARVAREPTGAIHCPMPVFSPDSTNQDRMPVSRPDTESAEHMPVAKSGCTNPLGNKARK
jgi:hypothetical protein